MMPLKPDSKATAPVSFEPLGDLALDESTLGDGIALCLSGGGYRAMLFHVGALWRLNEWGLLPGLARVSSVSGGSITAALLGMKWSALGFDQGGVAANFKREVVEPIRNLAGMTLDRGAVVGGILLPGSAAERVVKAYRKHLFGRATLQDLPDSPGGPNQPAPRFVINATNVQSGVLWRFSKPYMADYRVGRVARPRVELAVAVAASSAFPPVLSPLKMEVASSAYEPRTSEDLHFGEYLTDVVLTDGGVYDNLGLETAWKQFETVLVSDGGGQLKPEEETKSDWVRHGLRVNGIIDNQVRALRKRLLIQAYRDGIRKGTYWGIRSDISKFPAAGALPCPSGKTAILADEKTRLAKLPTETQERLINWGYAICDASMRRHCSRQNNPPCEFPYPGGVG